ncbi:MAG: trehalose-phosphatase [Myxococcaceae bacterium]|nr:trehalose-phosphatase [Myxococcaceae bacterium]
MNRNLLSPQNRDVLEQFASSDLLLAFDFDGTLAPIVADPMAAKMRPRTRELLVRLCRLYPGVVISGRSVADVRERVKGVGFLEVIGNHGLEPWKRSEDFAKKVRAWLPVLYQRLTAHKGIVIEDKGYSIAIHYRKSREKRLAKDAIYAAAAALMPLRVVGGHQVVNLLPDGAPHKGIALGAVRDRLGCDTSLYVGDDETDEDVFARDEPGRLLTIRVGQKSGTRAAFFIEDQAEIDGLLWQLLLLRSKPTHSAGRKAAGFS